MNRIVKFLRKPQMLRLIVSRCMKKCLLALVFVMLWRYLINQALLIVRDGFFVLGAIFLVSAWFSYLGLDGIEGPMVYFREKNRGKKPASKRSGDMIDYVEEDVVTMEDLSDDERHICGLCSSLFAALIFFVPSLISAFLAM